MTSAALRGFAGSVDVVTYEFENVALAAIDAVAPLVPVRPGRRALEVAQDRVAEKDFLRGLGLATAPYAAVDGPEALAEALARLGTPAILKTRRFGYDGKGQVRLDAGASAGEAWVALGGAPSVLEGFVGFEREISVIAARGLDGAVAAYDPGENEHRDGILHRTTRAGAAAARAGRGRGADRRADPRRARLRRRDRGRDVRHRPRASSSTRSRRGCTTPATGPKPPA